MPRHCSQRRNFFFAAVLLCLLSCCLPQVLPAAGKVCAMCGKKISGQYLIANKRVYCSRACYRKSLPRCRACGKVLEGKYKVWEGRKYCSSACVDKQLPKCHICGKPLRNYVVINGVDFCKKHAELPRCDGCGLPTAKGYRLRDGRIICKVCHEGAIHGLEDGDKIYRKAAAEIEKVTGLRAKTLPPLELVGRDKMPAASRGVPLRDIQERGFYKRVTKEIEKKNIFGFVLSRETKVERNIYILHNLIAEEFLSTACHELTHDIQAEFFPRITEDTPLWLKEGICQYAAAIVIRKYDLKDELAAIEKSKHPAYGDGYRWVKRKFGADNWAGLARWLRRFDASELPRRLDPVPPAP